MFEIKGAKIIEYEVRLLQAISQFESIPCHTNCIDFVDMVDSGAPRIFPSTSESPKNADMNQTLRSNETQLNTNDTQNEITDTIIFFGKGKHVAKVATLNEIIQNEGYLTKLEVYNEEDVACLRGIILLEHKRN